MKNDRGARPLHFTLHALTAIGERGIQREWVARVVSKPEWTEPDAIQPEVQLAFGRIPEARGRILRVVYADSEGERRIITAFFDRTKGRKTGGGA